MQGEKPGISVIIPTLEEQDYIEPILLRLREVEPAIEVIVVDGGSRDKTVEMARRFTDKVYKVTKRGIASGRNYGAAKASGDILVFLDADVAFSTDFPGKVLKTFRESDVVGATCNILPTKFKLGATTFFRIYNVLIRATSRIRPHSRGEFFAVRKKAFQEANGFNEAMPCLEDHDLAYRLSKLGRFVFISNLTVYESLRRFEKLGFRQVLGTWFTDYVFFMLRGRPLSQEWKPVR